MVAVIVKCVLKRDHVLQIPGNPTAPNLFYVNTINAFETYPMIKTNQSRDVNTLTMRIIQNFDQFVYMIEQSTH